MLSTTINISKDFSMYPSGRFRSDGLFSGEAFREDFLLPALKEYDKVIIKLEGCFGYASSFLEEVFGGLIRLGYFTKEELKNKLDFSNNPPEREYYIHKLLKLIDEAEPH